jgi:outer membrane protein insertion porin family
MGRGETLGVSVQSGNVRDLFELSYFVPWLFDRPQSAGFQLFKRDLDFNLLGSQRRIDEETGGVLTYGRSYGFFNSVRLSYGYADITSSSEFFNDRGERSLTSFVYEKSNVRPTWVFDSVDSRIEPTRGLRAITEMEYAGGPLGGDVDLYRPEVTLTYYRELQRRPMHTVAGFNLEAGWVEPFGEDPLPLNELYYIGGSRSIRGHTSRSISLRSADDLPVADEFGNVLGGSSFVEMGLEYHVLLGGPFRLVFFVDGGNVFGDGGQKFSFEALRATAGAELRLFVPVFGLPLRFIYSENLTPLPGDRFESFQFDVGMSF